MYICIYIHTYIYIYIYTYIHMYICIYRGLERVGSWVGRDQLAMAAKVRRHWLNPCRLGSRGRLGADFSLLLYTDLIKKRNHLETLQMREN